MRTTQTSGGIARRVGLGAITMNERTGGVAYVARLLHLALGEITHAPPLLCELRQERIGRPSVIQLFGAAARALTSLRRSRASEAPAWPDAWVFDHVATAQLASALPGRVRPRYAVFIHDVDGWSEDMAPRRARALRRATVRLANSAYTAARTMAAHPELGPVAACPLGLLPEAATEATHDAPTDPPITTTRTVVVLGRMSARTRYKGHEALVRLWPHVRQAVPDARLLVVGDGDDVPHLAAVARAAGVADSVTFQGCVPDAALGALLRRAGVLVMPSSREGFGLAALHAMRAGLPCVATGPAAAPGLVTDGVTGIVVGGEDPQALGRALVEVLLNDELRRTLGRAGHERYRAMYTFEHFRARLATLLEPLGLQPAPPGREAASDAVGAQPSLTAT